MALTTHEKIRVEAGFQSRFVKESFLTEPTGQTVFFVRSDFNVKFVPEFNTGNTIAGVSDVKVWCGLSGIGGVSRMAVISLDIDSGSVTLSKAPDSGCSLTISYSSSAVESQDVENVRLRAESMINQRLSLCYNLPISPTPSILIDYASRLSAALLLIRGYGSGSQDTSVDGYKLWNQLMGSGEYSDSDTTPVINIGEIGLICSSGYQLVDDNGTIISRNDEESITSDGTYKSGGRVKGRLYDISEEEFRYKDWQSNVDTDQPGSFKTSTPRQQG